MFLPQCWLSKCSLTPPDSRRLFMSCWKNMARSPARQLSATPAQHSQLSTHSSAALSWSHTNLKWPDSDLGSRSWELGSWRDCNCGCRPLGALHSANPADDLAWVVPVPVELLDWLITVKLWANTSRVHMEIDKYMDCNHEWNKWRKGWIIKAKRKRANMTNE